MIAGFGPDHPSWEVLREEMLRRIEKSRLALETPMLDPRASDFERGQINALRLIIKDIQEPFVEPVNTPGYDE